MDNSNIHIVIKKSNIEGVGVFPVYKIPKNTFIGVVIENNIVTYVGSKVNHSYTPTSRIIFDFTDNKYWLISNRELTPEDEITADYNYTPNFIKKPDPSWK